MKFKKMITFLMMSLALDSFFNSPIQATPKARFSIVYTNDVMGEVEPCG